MFFSEHDDDNDDGASNDAPGQANEEDQETFLIDMSCYSSSEDGSEKGIGKEKVPDSLCESECVEVDANVTESYSQHNDVSAMLLYFMAFFSEE